MRLAQSFLLFIDAQTVWIDNFQKTSTGSTNILNQRVSASSIQFNFIFLTPYTTQPLNLFSISSGQTQTHFQFMATCNLTSASLPGSQLWGTQKKDPQDMKWLFYIYMTSRVRNESIQTEFTRPKHVKIVKYRSRRHTQVAVCYRLPWVKVK